MQAMESNSRKFSWLNQQGIILIAMKEKMQQIRRDIDSFKECIAQYQLTLVREVKLRSEAEAKIKNLEDELKEAQQEVHVAHATIRNNKRQRKTLERKLQFQAETLDWFEKKLIELSGQLKDADHHAQHCMHRVNELTASLIQSDKQLEQSRANNGQLEGELKAAAQNLHCVECAFERSSQQALSADRQIEQLQRLIHESDLRGFQAESRVQQIQKHFNNLEQDLEKRWHLIIRKLNELQ